MQWPPTRPGVKWQEIPFGARGRQHVAGVDVEHVEDRRQLVHERDVEIALRVLDHLGGFRDLDRRRAMDAGRDHRAVDVGDDVERRCVLPRHHLGDGLEAMRLVAGIDALGRIADREIRARASGRRLAPAPARNPLRSRRDRPSIRRRRCRPASARRRPSATPRAARARSGRRASSIGVGTVTMKKSAAGELRRIAVVSAASDGADRRLRPRGCGRGRR